MRGPVIVTVARSVPLPPAAVWVKQVSAEQWTTWHPDVSWVSPDAMLAFGRRFEYVWRGTRARARVCEYRPQELLAWSSETASGPSTMRWTFDATDGTTLVVARAMLGRDHALTRRPAAARLGMERALGRWLEALASEPRYAYTA